MDLDMAAAYAAGGQPPPQAFARQQPPHRGPPRQHQQQFDEGQEEVEELPNVDDLEVAAAAAGVAPVPAVLAEMGYYELGVQPKQAAESSSSEEENEESSSSSSSEEEDSDVEDKFVAVNGNGAAAAVPAAVRLHLQLVGDDSVAVQLVANGIEAMDVEAAPDSDFEGSGAGSSSDSSSDSDGEAAGTGGDEDEPLDVVTDYDDIKKMIDDMDADEDGGAAVDPSAHGAEVELLGAGAPLPSLAALDIKPDDAVQAAGAVQSMLEGMIVIKAQGGSRALTEGCVLVLDDRTPIGCIEEIFGPVMSPFYALRYAGQQPMPASLAPGATVYSVDRLADFVLPEALRVRGYDLGPEEEEELEAQFSDDEAEARHRQKMKSKRKEAPEGLQLGGRGTKHAHGGRGGRGSGGRGGRGRAGGRGGGQQAGYGPPPPAQQQQQQAFYHPHQQGVPAQPAGPPAAGRVFSGRLLRGQQPPPPPGFQAHATAAQLTGMTLQQQQQQQQGGIAGYGGFYGGAPAPQAYPGGQMLRPQYAAAPPQQQPAPRRQGAGSVMSAQYAGPRPPMVPVMQVPGMQPMQQQVPGMQPVAPPPQFTPALPFPPPQQQ